jgi:hypothetical protein
MVPLTASYIQFPLYDKTYGAYRMEEGIKKFNNKN